MTEYIKKSDAEAALLDLRKGYRRVDEKCAVDGCRLEIRDLPAEDVEPIKHGRWIPSDIDIDEYEQCMSDDDDWYDWECSVCHEQVSYVEPVKRRHLTKYCHNCGAKMDAKE